MSQDWYWADSGERRGPVHEADLTRLVREGQLVHETPVWCAGFSDWQAAGRQPWFIANVPVMTPPPLPPPLFAPVATPVGGAVAPFGAGTDATRSSDPDTLLCPACRTAIASQALRCPSCHISFQGGYGASLRGIWPRAKRWVLIVAAVVAMLNVASGIGAVLSAFLGSVMSGVFIVLLYAKVVADRSTTLGESVRTGGRWRETGGSGSAFFFWWSD